MNLANIVQRGWEAVGAGDFDTLVTDYVEEMTFIMPGQADVLKGRQAFRSALDGLGEILLQVSKLRGFVRSKEKMKLSLLLSGSPIR